MSIRHRCMGGGWPPSNPRHRAPPPPSPVARTLHQRRDGGEGRGGGGGEEEALTIVVARRRRMGRESGRGEEWSGGEGGGGENDRVKNKKRSGKLLGVFFAIGWDKSPACENTLIFVCGYFKRSVRKKYFFHTNILRSCMEKWGSIFTYTNTYDPSVNYWGAHSKKSFLVGAVDYHLFYYELINHQNF